MSALNNSLLLGQEGGGGYAISRSLRFNSVDSAYLSRTPASAGNRKTWTWAGWVKRSRSGIRQALFAGHTGGAGNYNTIEFEADNLTFFYGGTAGGPRTAAVFRDPSAWMHICVALDTTQATAANRVKIYVNGTQQVIGSGTYPSQNADLQINATSQHDVGADGGYDYLSGYLADIHFIDGQALDPTSFGEFDDNGIWQPIEYTGSYGTNGFHLDFADNSSAAALGTDTSGNGNTWSVNNISVTAGAGNDSLVDVPSSTGTDTGVGGEVRGNYCTWNPLDLPSSSSLVNGNLDFVNTSGSWKSTVGTIAVSSGKWYAEFSGNPGSAMVGIVRDTWNANIADSRFWASSTGYSYHSDDGNKYNNGSGSSYGATYTGSDVIGVALDMDAGTLTFYKNGTSQGQAFSGLTGAFKFAYGGTSMTANFGQRPFAYTAPSGFKSLCTANLPAPVITKPSDVMDVKLYTGNGSTQTISGLGFSPNLVWIKGRSGATDHALYDTVRGVQQQLESNTTTDETTESTGLTAFNSDGFALGALAQANTSSATYTAWCWDESVSAGFDIVTYTGNGSARTIAHSLGVAPSMIIVKARTTASTDQGWPVYHSANTAAPATDYLLLNDTAATADLDTVWNDTAPTSSVFSVGTNALVNANADTYVAYCFAPVAGYSSFGSYTGNGSADGPFIYTGFRPRFVMLKGSSFVSNWHILDAARNAYNVTDSFLRPNLSSQELNGITEGAGSAIDILSNGFKLRASFADSNTNAASFVWAAFAESPFQYARAR
jgi:hypothetical protein